LLDFMANRTAQPDLDFEVVELPGGVLFVGSQVTGSETVAVVGYKSELVARTATGYRPRRAGRADCCEIATLAFWRAPRQPSYVDVRHRTCFPHTGWYLAPAWGSNRGYPRIGRA
jgi:hypothetical protein